MGATTMWVPSRAARGPPQDLPWPRTKDHRLLFEIATQPLIDGREHPNHVGDRRDQVGNNDPGIATRQSEPDEDHQERDANRCFRHDQG